MITNIEVTKLLQHPDNPRKSIGDVTELAESIKARGILQNLTVVPAENGMYTVIIGHRRLAAAKQAGLTEVPCAVVDMDYKTQLSTMLLENMQRSDLTVYEQAQGMQMMFNLGVPVAEIVEKTGFAETTVRKRLKIATLPAEQMQRAVKRGGKLDDYVKVAEIKNEKQRKALLNEIGTGNFDFKYKSFLRNQKRKENEPLIEKELKKIGAQKSQNLVYNAKYENVTSCDMKDWKEGTFKAQGDEPLYWEISHGWAYLMKKKPKAPKTRTEKSEAEKRVERLNRELKEVSETAYKCREDFIQGFTATQKYSDTILKWLVFFAGYNLIEYPYTNYDYVNRVIESDVKPGSQYANRAKMMEFLDSDKKSKAIIMLYTITSDNKKVTYYRNGYCDCVPVHKENKRLDKIYECLCELGYEMSETERQLQNGTHELFKGE